MTEQPTIRWDSFWIELENLKSSIAKIKSINVNLRDVRSQAKSVVQHYFREIRPEFRDLGIDTAQIDDQMQGLLQLANGQNPKRSYQRTVKALEIERNSLEAQREIRLGESMRIGSNEYVPTDTEKGIISTLSRLVPGAAVSYRQVLVDLSGPSRTSYRGTAAELREVLREVLDHMATDEAVLKSDGFQLEKDRTTPTMRQKVHFILRSRGSTSSTMKTPEQATLIIEKASLVRSTYERASSSTHTGSTRREVLQLKLYVDTVLSEILIVPSPTDVARGQDESS